MTIMMASTHLHGPSLYPGKSTKLKSYHPTFCPPHEKIGVIQLYKGL